MDIEYALSQECPRCNAAIGALCKNPQNYQVLPHKVRRGEHANRHSKLLLIALADIAIHGETTVKSVSAQYGDGKQYSNVTSALSRLVEEGKLTLVCKRGATRVFGAPLTD